MLVSENGGGDGRERLASLVATRASKGKPPGPPRSLRSRQARDLWRRVVGTYEIEPGHHTALLEAACVALDRQIDAREAIERDGLIVTGQGGTPKQHPACAIERDSRIGMCRALRELGLDAEAPKDRAGREFGT